MSLYLVLCENKPPQLVYKDQNNIALPLSTATGNVLTIPPIIAVNKPTAASNEQVQGNSDSLSNNEDQINNKEHRNDANKNKVASIVPQVTLPQIQLSSAEYEDTLKNLLPKKFAYKITKLKGEADNNFLAEIRVDLRTDADVAVWLDEFQKVSDTQWRCGKTFKFPVDGHIIYKKQLRCYRNVASHRRYRTNRTNLGKMNTLCKAKLMITVKNFQMKRSKDPYLKDFPGSITYRHEHNHPINDSSECHRRVEPSVNKALGDLYEKGHSPASALKIFTFDLQLQHGKDFLRYSADYSKCPSLAYCQRLFKITVEKPLGKENFTKRYGGKGLWFWETLSTLIEQYNESCGEKCATLYQSGKLCAITICSPLMKRVHRHLSSSGEVCFVWSSGRMFRYNLRLFILFAPSAAEPLPLGMFLITHESEALLRQALEDYHSLLGDWAFFNNGSRGPAVIITDDTAYEKDVFRGFYHNAFPLLNVTYVLQEFWRYLVDEKRGVSKSVDRIEVFRLFQTLVNWPNEDGFDEQVQIVLEYSLLVKYPSVQDYLQHELIPRSHEWALCKRVGVLKTENYSEAIVKVLYRTMTFGLVPLVDFLTTRLDRYFEDKLTARLKDRLDSFTSSRYNSVIDLDMSASDCYQLSDGIYKVVSTGRAEKQIVNEVNMLVGVCTCQSGLTGQLCKHQYAVITKYDLQSKHVIQPCDERTKTMLHLVLHGNVDNIPPEYYAVETLSAAAAITLPSANQHSAAPSSPTQHFATLPSSTLPSARCPSATLPSTTLPSATLPSATLPSETIASAMVPSATLLSATLPFENQHFAVCDEVPITELSPHSPARSSSSVDFDYVSHEVEVPQDEDDIQRINQCKRDLGRIFDSLKENVQSRPNIFVPAVEKFIDSFKVASETGDSLVYALSTFNQFTGHVEVEMGEAWIQESTI